jgi:tagatose 1,6-diphosphate aldolase
MAGRAIWGDGVGRHDRARREEGARTAVSRLRELHETLVKEGRGWHRPVSPADTVAMVTPGWFRDA